MNDDILLEIRNLSVKYTTDDEIKSAVNNLSVVLGKGETLGIVGETGAGKTTTALSIMRLIPDPPGEITNGEIIFERVNLLEISEKKMRKIRGKKISMIFQDPMTSLNPVMTIGDQIAEVVALHNKYSKAKSNIESVKILETVGIPGDRFSEYPHQFSGGMKQRVGIAIALACNPLLLIADEPTTALDVTIQAQILKLMEQLKNKFQTSMILITHDLGVVAEICNKVAIVYAGEIIEYGTLEHIFNNTKHPYAVGLFESIPNFNKKVKRLKPIEGFVPDPSSLPIGCNFYDRCKGSMEICKQNNPDIVEMESGHTVKCFKYQRNDAL